MIYTPIWTLGVDLEQNIVAETGSGIKVVLEKSAKDIFDGEKFERTNVAACGMEERDFKEFKIEINESSLVCRLYLLQWLYACDVSLYWRSFDSDPVN